MSAAVILSKLAPKALRLIWYQTNAKAARINCTGFSCAVAETTLPYVPVIVPVNAAQGEFDMLPPNQAGRAALDRKRSYAVAIVLSNGVGQPLEELKFSVGIA